MASILERVPNRQPRRSRTSRLPRGHACPHHYLAIGSWSRQVTPDGHVNPVVLVEKQLTATSSRTHRGRGPEGRPLARELSESTNVFALIFATDKATLWSSLDLAERGKAVTALLSAPSRWCGQNALHTARLIKHKLSLRTISRSRHNHRRRITIISNQRIQRQSRT